MVATKTHAVGKRAVCCLVFVMLAVAVFYSLVTTYFNGFLIYYYLSLHYQLPDIEQIVLLRMHLELSFYIVFHNFLGVLILRALNN